jgi:DNA helicase IV
MINKALEIIQSNPAMYISRFDHILVDEFQDISHQRLELLKQFVNKKTNTKLFAVGDDWQSINKFAGSDVDYFIDFERYFSRPSVTYLEANYRCAKEIIETSNALIAHNEQQRDKTVVAKSGISGNVILYSTSYSVWKSQAEHVHQKHVVKVIARLFERGVMPDQILILARYNRPIITMKEVLRRQEDSRFSQVRTSTIHKAKGTEADYVFILNIISGGMGFPSEILDDSVLEIIKPISTKIGAFEEERRLFYVALTRAKKAVCLFTHQSNPSIFINEIEGFTNKEITLEYER